MKPTDFFTNHPVFRREAFLEAYLEDGNRKPESVSNVLKQHVSAGNLVLVKRGVYAVTKAGWGIETGVVDPYLVATNLSPDAVVAYHAALQFHGKTYSLWDQYHYFTESKNKSLVFDGSEFLPVQHPANLQRTGQTLWGVETTPHGGGTVRVTSLERTLVDVLDRPESSGGWEEVFRSLELIEYLRLDEVVDYTRHVGAHLTAARVGWFLERMREEWNVGEDILRSLAEMAPKSPRYIDSKRELGRLQKPWNIIVPERVLEQRWEEFA